MSRDDIIRMAREAGLDGYGTPLPAIERFAALVAEQPKPSEDVEALRRDAERYRWLRNRAWFQFEFEGRYGDSGETVQELDAAIDAVMGEKR